MKNKSNNCADYFNANYLHQSVKLLIDSEKDFQIVDGSYLEFKSSQKHDCKIIDQGLEILEEIDYFNYQKGDIISPFEILIRYQFNGNITAAINYIEVVLMKKESNYVRVGTDFFKKIIVKDRMKIPRQQLKVWKESALRLDLGKEWHVGIPKYDNFVVVPNNKNYKAAIGNSYNLYKPFSHQAIEYDGDESKIKWSMHLMNHIFGEKLKQGLIYMQVLYLHPDRMLPIVALISQKRSTGKTTFLNWLNAIFAENMVFISPQDIGSSFNEIYASANIIAIEESKFDGTQSLEKLKQLSTSKYISENRKHVSAAKLEFYGKIIITSNNERKFVAIDKEEIRYFVLKIDEIKGQANHNIEEDLVKEIPHFLGYLESLPPIDFTKSRMILSPEEIESEALQKVKDESKSWLYVELEERFKELFMQYGAELEVIEFCLGDLSDYWFRNNSKVSLKFLRETLDEMGVERTDSKQRYMRIQDIERKTKEGNALKYTVTRELLGMNDLSPDEIKTQEDFKEIFGEEEFEMIKLNNEKKSNLPY